MQSTQSPPVDLHRQPHPDGAGDTAYDVLTRLPKMLIAEVASLTPEAWAKAQRQPPDLKAAS